MPQQHPTYPQNGPFGTHGVLAQLNALKCEQELA